MHVQALTRYHHLAQSTKQHILRELRKKTNVELQ